MQPYSYAIISALLWALSTPIVNLGLSNLPNKRRPGALFVGLVISLACGTLSYYLFNKPSMSPDNFRMPIFLSGLLTFPIGTGLYYVCGYAYENRLDVAAQYAKVKPLSTILLAFLVAKEPISKDSLLPIAFVVIAIFLLLTERRSGKGSSFSVLFGLLTAISWSLGEVIIKMQSSDLQIGDDTFWALFSGTIAGAVSLLIFLAIKGMPKLGRWLIPFCIHGVLSFGFAYYAFFRSIHEVGLVPTAVVNACWPFLALIINHLIARFTETTIVTAWQVWIAGLGLLLASLLQIY